MRNRLITMLSIGSALIGLLILAVMVGSSRHVEGARAADSRQAVLENKVIAPKDVLDEMTPGVRLWHDYGAFALYSVSTPALEQLAPSALSRIQVADEMDWLLFDSYPFNTQRDSLEIPPELSASPGAGPGLHLVQFVGPIKDSWLEDVESTGAELVHYIANNGYLVWADAGARARLSDLAGEGDFVQYSAPYHPYFKLGPTLLGRLSAPAAASETVQVTIQMYRHRDSEATEAAIRALSVEAHSSWQPILRYQNIIVSISMADLREVIARPDVYWVGERLERELMDEVQGQILAGNLDGSQAGPSSPGYLPWLTGLGFSTDQNDYPVVDITDDGIGNGTVSSGDPTLHVSGLLANPSRLSYIGNCTGALTGEGVDGHGHINVSIAGGYDTRSGFAYVDPDGYQRGLGINPYGRFAGTRIFAPSFDLSACGGTDTGLIKSEQDNGALISSNSWGCSGCSGSYDDSSQAFDVGVRDADLSEPGNQQMIFIFAAGNSGPTSASVGTPGNGKNMITVGASENDRPSDEDGSWTDGCGIGPTGADNAMDVISFSSRGPSPGNRVKPEVIGPGTHVQGTASTSAGYTGNSVCDQYRPSGQTTFASSSGTSHSTPAVAGVSSLVYWWMQNNLSVSAPSPALMKAYLIAHPTYLTGLSANDTLPSNSQGYGMPNMSLMFDNVPKQLVNQTAVFDNSGETWSWIGIVVDPTKPVRIVMAYTDQAGAIGVSPQINNLNLDANVGGTNYLGNVFSGQWSTTGGTADSNNNYEAIFLPAGTSGTIDITVTGFNIAGDGVPNQGDGTDQDFALVCYNCASYPDFTVDATPASLSICKPQDASYTVDIGQILGFSDPVTLSAGGEPSGTTTNFTANPVTPPGSSTLIIGNTAAAAVGNYSIDVIGIAPTSTHTTTVGLGVFDAVPGSPTLTAPANGATNVSLWPTFTWTAVGQADTYHLEVATDSGFSNVVYTTTVSATSDSSSMILNPLTAYHWRVQALNPCGGGTLSPVFSFTTQPLPPILLVDDDDNSPDVRGSYTNTLESLGFEYDVWDTNNTDNEPDAADLAQYLIVIWFTGDEFGGFAGPGPASETVLANWLDAGNKCLFVSSQDYHWDRGLTPFMQNYLGVLSASNDFGDYTSVSGTGSVFGGLGPYSLDYVTQSLSDYSDIINAAASPAEVALNGNNSNGAAVDKDTGSYRTTFWGFPWEALSSPAARDATMFAFLDGCPTGIVINYIYDVSLPTILKIGVVTP